MSVDAITDREAIALEAVEAPGGDVHIIEVRQLVRKPLRKCLYDLLSSLFSRGLVVRYAPGRYAINSRGREALAQARQWSIAS